MTFARVPRRGRARRRRARGRAGRRARARRLVAAARPGSSRWCSSARSPGSARCRTRCCRSTASARSASSPSRPGAKLLIVPSEWNGFDFEAMARDDRRAPRRASRCWSSTASCPRATRRRCRRRRRHRPTTPTTAPMPLGVLHVGHDRRPEGRAPHRPHDHGVGVRHGRRRSTIDRGGPQRDGVPVHPHRRHRLAVRGADGRLPAILVEAFDPATTIPVLKREGVTLAGAGTPFHLAYLAAQRANPDEQLFPDGARVRRRRRGQAAAAALRGQGGARRRRHRVAATA